MFQNTQVKTIYYDNRVRLSLHFHLASLKKVLVVEIKTPEITKHWGRQGTAGTLTYFWWECKIGTIPLNTIWHHLARLSMCKPLDPEIPLLGICLRATFARMCQETWTKTCS